MEWLPVLPEIKGLCYDSELVSYKYPVPLISFRFQLQSLFPSKWRCVIEELPNRESYRSFVGIEARRNEKNVIINEIIL